MLYAIKVSYRPTSYNPKSDYNVKMSMIHYVQIIEGLTHGVISHSDIMILSSSTVDNVALYTITRDPYIRN